MFNNSYELLNCPISLCCHKSLILAVDHLKRLKSNVILCDTISCGSMMSDDIIVVVWFKIEKDIFSLTQLVIVQNQVVTE